MYWNKKNRNKVFSAHENVSGSFQSLYSAYGKWKTKHLEKSKEFPKHSN